MIDTITAICTTQELSYMGIESDETIEFLEALEYSLVKMNSLSVPFWSEQIGAERLNRILYVLGNRNLVVTKVAKRYADVKATSELVDRIGDVLDFRIDTKIHKYGMKLDLNDHDNDLVKTPSGIKRTGLVRPGFAYSAKQSFRLDVDMLVEYREAIIVNATKSIEKTMLDYSDIALDEANYREMCEVVIDNYIANPSNMYNLEYNVSDQRGRAIYNGIKRVFNPVSSKDCRSLLVASKPVVISRSDVEALSDIYLWIAELLGCKRTTIKAKKLAGMMSYYKRDIPVIDLDTDEGRKELHEVIWLTRMYAKLDTLFSVGTVVWDIPLEMDAGMCLAQVIGATLNSEELLVKTNAVGTKIEDPWHIEGVRRVAGKTVGTPTFYGSSQSAISLLKSKHITPDKDELLAISKEFSNGTFSIIKDFKNMLIKNMDVQTPTYEVQGWNETYTVEVNKSKAVGAQLNAHVVWDTVTRRDKVFFLHTPITIPDYARFKLFGPTGYVHNVESKVVDNTMAELALLEEWAISIHDAILCLPGSKARSNYISNLEALNAVGIDTLVEYMKSIGAITPKANIALAKILDKVTPNTKKFSENALK